MIIFIIFLLTVFIGLFNNNNNNTLKYKKNYKYCGSNISNNQYNNDLIFDNIDSGDENDRKNNLKKNYYTINTISQEECEELFSLYFNINKIIVKKNTKNPIVIQKKTKNISLLVKKNSEKKEKKHINKTIPLKKDDTIKKNIIPKSQNISLSSNNKNLDKNKITKNKKEVSLKKASPLNHNTSLEASIKGSAVKFKQNFSMNSSFFVNTNNHFIKNSYKNNYTDNKDLLLIENELSDEDVLSFDSIDKLDVEEIIEENELEEYVIRLKKNINQFPGKKVNLDIIILLDKSLIKEIIFPKKLFSLAYKMYIINILHKIEIPKKLWNKKLVISL
jgi:DNA gyrase/topoisomerase IV subunit A